MNLKVFSAPTQEYQDNAVLYANDLLKVGITFSLDLPTDNAEEGTRGTACDYQVQSRRSSGPIDPDIELQSLLIHFEGDSVWTCGWRDPQYLVDAFYAQSAELDRVKRGKMIHDLEKAYYEDRDIGYRWINEHWTSYLVGHWPHVKGGGWDRNWFFRFDQVVAEDVWLDKK